MSIANNMHIDLFREQILAAAKNKSHLSIEGGGTKSWYGNANSYAKLDTRPYSGILEYQPEELVITACAGTPLKEIEVSRMIKDQDTNDNITTSTSLFSKGEEIKVTEGAFSTFKGTITSVDSEKQKIKVEVLIFSRPTEVELDFLQVERV